MNESKIKTNRYGNVNIFDGIQPDCVHIRGKRLQPTARKLGIEFAQAMVGWAGSRRYPRPDFDGIIILKSDEQKFLDAMVARKSKELTPEKRNEKRWRKQERDTARFASAIREQFPMMPISDLNECAEHATEIGSGRVGRSSTAENSAYAAVVAYIRHNKTDYEELLDGDGDYDERQWRREYAREQIASDLRKYINDWQTIPQDANGQYLLPFPTD